jgi:RNA polymerase sigma factor (sigma-70 family)
MLQDNPDELLIESFLRGEKDAFLQVQSLISKLFSKWRDDFGKNSAEADDVKDDVLFKLLSSLRKGEFRGDSKLSTFVSSIVSNTCISHIRFRKRFIDTEPSTMPLQDNAKSPEQILEEKQHSKLNWRALRRAPKECIKLWHMQLRDRMSCKEIGDKLHRSESAIKWKLWDCRRRVSEIRKRLKKKDKPLWIISA